MALEAEFLVSSLEPALEDLGLSELFVGLIVIPIIGNAAEHSSAIMFAMRNKVDVTLEIAIGSSTQIALFVAPALVFISLFVGHPMDFVFSTFEVAAVALSTILVFMISSDGRSNWLEGAQLTGAYVIMAISFFFVEASVRTIVHRSRRSPSSSGRSSSPVAGRSVRASCSSRHRAST